MKTLIFGGSFDPFHNGHLQVASTIKKYYQLDKIVYLIAGVPRWKKPLDKRFRLEMLKLGLKGQEGEISLIEYDSLDEVNYTYNSLKKYQEAHQDEEIYFLIGYDQLNQLNKWYQIDKMQEFVHFIAVPRGELTININQMQIQYLSLYPDQISSMSSTSLRRGQCLDAPKSILDYIVEHNLYYIPKIKALVDEKRFLHSVSVANLCYEIALTNQVNPTLAYQAGLFHDIAKCVKKEEMISFMKDNYPFYLEEIPYPLYHQFKGVEILKEEFGIDNQELLHAVKVHATGDQKMSKLDKILYASDKIEPTRGYDSSSLIALCKQDINQGFKAVLQENIIFFEEKKIPYQNQLTLSCINQYLRKEEN